MNGAAPGDCQLDRPERFFDIALQGRVQWPQGVLPPPALSQVAGQLEQAVHGNPHDPTVGWLGYQPEMGYTESPNQTP